MTEIALKICLLMLNSTVQILIIWLFLYKQTLSVKGPGWYCSMERSLKEVFWQLDSILSARPSRKSKTQNSKWRINRKLYMIRIVWKMEVAERRRKENRTTTKQMLQGEDKDEEILLKTCCSKLFITVRLCERLVWLCILLLNTNQILAFARLIVFHWNKKVFLWEINIYLFHTNSWN